MKHLLLKIQLQKRAVSCKSLQVQAEGLISKLLFACMDEFIQVQTSSHLWIKQVKRRKYYTKSWEKQGPPLYLTTKGSLQLISRKTDLRIYTAQLIALHQAHGLDLKPIKNRELGKDESLVVKFGSIHTQPRTRQDLMPCDLHSIIYLASRFFAVYRKLTWTSSLHKLEKITPELSLGL